MTPHLKSYWESLWDVAEGRGTAQVTEHVSGCKECASALNEIRSILAGLTYPNAQPGQDLLNAAYALMPQTQRRLSFLSSSLSLLGSRSAVKDDFQVAFGEGDLKIRVMYSPNGARWDVMTSLPESADRAMKQGVELELETGRRLMFTVDSLADAGFTVQCGDELFEIPSPNEVMRERE